MRAFGPGVRKPDGVIDRPELGKLVFGNPARLKQVSAARACTTRAPREMTDTNAHAPVE